MKMLTNKKGQGTMEYVLIAALVVGLVVYLVNHVRQPVQTNIDKITTNMSNGAQ
jgi:hypothetical protein